MPQQQQQVLRPFWQHKVMVESLYPIYAAPVNFHFHDKVDLHASCNSCNVSVHELPDSDERLLRQHVLLLRTRLFWHSGLIDRL
jgi:hypothetical protein